ncbi:hypothetical protein GCM10022229_03100 [Luteimonas lutimaris]|uniref:Uncharacterized protein n=2 Tax=Luteimonas lutimaris TaxID=698645 RepID=A0ABP7M7F4_9GAMM
MVSLSGNLPGHVDQLVDTLINRDRTERPDRRDGDRTTGGRDPASRTGTGNSGNTGNTGNAGNNNGVGNNGNGNGSGNNNGVGNNGNGNGFGNNNGVGNNGNGNGFGNNNGVGNNGNGVPNLGGNQQPGIIGNTLNTLHQPGNSLFGAMNPLQRAPGMMAASPAAQYNSNASPQAAAAQQSGPPQYSQASQSAYYGPGVRADARAQFAAMPVSVLNANATLASARPGAPISAFAAGGPMAAAGNSGPAGTTGPAATVATAMAQQPAGPATTARADAAQLAAQTMPPGNAQLAARADAAALAAARAAALATAAAAPGTLAQATTFTPAGNPLALSAPGLTMAAAPTNPAADARGVILPTHDAATSQRAENAMNPAGHTLDGAQRRQRDRRMSSMPQGGLARLLWAVGAAGHTSEGREASAERDARRAMQWLFWILTLIAYGCLAGAIIVFAGSDGRLADSISDRNSTAALAMCGLAAGVIAWGVARWMSRRR